MKIHVLIALIILIGLGSSGTYQLGSHNVSLNLSVPANYTIEIPAYLPDTDSWWYKLNISPNTGGFLSISIGELGNPMYGSSFESVARSSVEDANAVGIGGYKYAMTEFQGNDAFEEYIPAQRVLRDGKFILSGPETYRITYLKDELTVIMVSSQGAGEALYQEALSTIDITETGDNQQGQQSQQEFKSFLGPTSAYAGPGKGAKPGMENQNAVTLLGDSQYSNITVTAQGVR